MVRPAVTWVELLDRAGSAWKRGTISAAPDSVGVGVLVIRGRDAGASSGGKGEGYI